MRRVLITEGALAEGVVELDDSLKHYLFRVLRLRTGDQVCLCDGAGREVEGTVQGDQIATDTARIMPRPPGPRLTLIQALGKGDKMDSVVRQASELGAVRIVPIITERAVPEHERRVERWRSIAEDATRVSGRAYRPLIDPVTRFDVMLQNPREEASLCLHPEGQGTLRAASSVELLIGPEGGFAPDEIERAIASGFELVGLGRHTLRTETAGPAAVAILQFLGVVLVDRP